ncbi:extracellular solute-binding protein [Paenibacillus qinlingensis]|uniref:Aldouronate transport system substrate-binding protein n=1 Tax=Paenibacillus qinlingensis TaxID=1837343 RepID=A0ABU1NTS6_9BACL|nr:extracellular solute-binding protein [Paenibacillus qinlingensis]MDR6550887.1 putative aldouronate transport system substrate-binding protein [Paenibacillus qinlingensis]
MKSKKIFNKMTTGSLLIALLTSTVMSGCIGEEKKAEQTNSTPTGTAIKLPFEKPVKFRVWDPLMSTALPIMKNYAESELNKELQKRLNVTIEYIHPTEGSAKEQFNLMLTSGDIPDFIVGTFGDYPGGREKAFEDGILVDLKNEIPKYAPDLAKIYETYPDLLMDVETEGGKQFGAPFLKGDQSIFTFFGGFLRKDWLTELGMPVPETIDEFYTVMKTFKEKKGATAPFTGTVGNIKGTYFTGAWGINQDHFIENGKVVYGAIDPRFKEYTKTMVKWYKDGILDPELATNNGKTIDAKITANQAGATLGNTGSGLGKYLPLMKSKDPKFDLVAVPYLVRNKGDFNPFMPKDGPTVNNGTWNITSAAKNIPEALAFLNYGYTKEGSMLYNFGIEGVSYKMENGYPKYTDLVTNNPNGQPFATMGQMYTRALKDGPFVQDKRYFEQYMVLPQQQESLKVWTKYADQVTKANKNYRGNLTPEEVSQITSKQNEINTYKDEMFLKWLMGKEDVDATWDKYVEQIKKLGIEDINKVRQNAYDRFIKKFPQALNPQSFNISDIFK